MDLLSVFLLTAILPAADLPTPAARPVDFVRDVQPLLRTYCLDCHGPTKQKGGYRLDQRQDALREGNILPGQSAQSPLVHRVAGIGPEKRMPPTGAPLTAKQIALLRAWIDQGAKWPVVAASSSEVLHWAYRPLERPRVPTVRDRSGIDNPIDAFLQHRLEAAGLTPAPLADRRTLLRRATFDLHGLPPTPEELAAFETDSLPNAWARVVDRLLAAPGYGERQARHWLDVVHFAETHGHDQDVPREHAWPYRDYLIRAFNEHRPWGRMIEEQVAGDILFPDQLDGVVATGMLAAGPWDESSQQSIRDDTLDKKQAQYLDRDDMITTVMSAFSSTTVQCARCHDHKFDPISQEEYYGLQAVFAGVDRANRAYDLDAAVFRRRRDLAQSLRGLEKLPIDKLLTAATQERVAAWERAHAPTTWHLLEPVRVVTAHGSVPTTLPDQSVRFGGPRPPRDTYTVTTLARRRVTALRLEVLADETLPQGGPGRQDNGNLHLNEIRIRVAPADRPTESTVVRVARAVADFDQAGWEIGKAIDGRAETAWGIHPAVGKSHQAVFVLESPVEHPSGSMFTVTLEQTHGQGHLIGRLRLAVSSEPPGKLAPHPTSLATILSVAPGKRTPEQLASLTRHVLLEETRTQLAQLPAPAMVYTATTDFATVGSFRPAKGCRPVSLLRRGEITKPVKEARPGALGFIPGLAGRLDLASPDDEGARRAGLARWLSDPRNVLTWRSMANRVWHHHFGRGIVASPGDLGKMGATPTHPELLDWLAVELRDSGGSLARLHRLILTSRAYRRSVRDDAVARKIDGDNHLLWRMNRTRLDAESVRDAVLAVSGELNRHMGGPSVRHFHESKGIHVTPNVDYSRFDLDGEGARRRSVYRFIFRTLADPFLEVLDCPDASQFTPARASSLTALQALALLNDRFMVHQAERLARRLEREAPTLTERLGLAFALALSRPVRAEELALLTRYAERHGLANACRLVLNTNEFLFVD